MKLFTGIAQLIESPSGIFALLCLVALSILTWIIPAMATAWIPFFGIVPAVLAIVEHRETLAAIQQNTNQQDMNLPSKGQI